MPVHVRHPVKRGFLKNRCCQPLKKSLITYISLLSLRRAVARNVVLRRSLAAICIGPLATHWLAGPQRAPAACLPNTGRILRDLMILFPSEKFDTLPSSGIFAHDVATLIWEEGRQSIAYSPFKEWYLLAEAIRGFVLKPGSHQNVRSAIRTSGTDQSAAVDESGGVRIST